MKIFGLLLISVLLSNCDSTNSIQEENIYWVNSAKLDCTGVGKMSCLQIQKGNIVDLNKKWDLFYSQIEGFEYQPGFIYKLKVKEVTIENPPADASSIKYTLIEILEKKKDTRYNIHDIYILISINGKELNASQIEKQPTLEINITKMQIIGNNGCNNFSGSISELNENRINFGPLRETKMMCENMKVPNLYSNNLAKVNTFKKGNGSIQFYDHSNKSILLFKKID